MLQIEAVGKKFSGKNSLHVLNDISLTVKPGEFVCIIGPSGCGKTVLLHIIAGLTEKTTGNISLDGNPISRPNNDRLLMFQNYALFPWLTVQGNILFGMKTSLINTQEKTKRLEKYLKLVDLEKFRDWYPHKLSGGMQQRVALARALSAQPKILLMDEPFSAVDAQTRNQLREHLVNIWQETKTTILFVTHGVTEAVYLGDTVYVMSKRPATVKKKFEINLPRPRDRFGGEFTKLAAAIEKELENN